MTLPLTTRAGVKTKPNCTPSGERAESFSTLTRPGKWAAAFLASCSTCLHLTQGGSAPNTFTSIKLSRLSVAFVSADLTTSCRLRLAGPVGILLAEPLLESSPQLRLLPIADRPGQRLHDRRLLRGKLLGEPVVHP
jgi:hypothetical protein